MAVIPVIKGLRPFFCFLPSDAKYITPPVPMSDNERKQVDSLF